MSTSGRNTENKIRGLCEGHDAPYVKLVSCDGHLFFIKKEYALISNTIHAMLIGPREFCVDVGNEVDFLEISSHILRVVCRYFNYKIRYSNMGVNIPEFDIKPEFAVELLIAAAFLDC